MQGLAGEREKGTHSCRAEREAIVDSEVRSVWVVIPASDDFICCHFSE